MRTASLLGLLSIAGNVVGAPIVSRAFHDGDRVKLERFCRIAALVMGLPAILGFAFLLLAGRWMLALFDPGFVDAYPALVILAGGFAFSAACGPTGYFQQMIGEERAYFSISAGKLFDRAAGPALPSACLRAYRRRRRHGLRHDRLERSCHISPPS